MSEVLTDRIRWTVSSRSSGEVLAVRVGESALQLGFLGCPRGLQAAEIQGWLGELAGMAAAASDPIAGTESDPALPIPRSLHQALTGLLFLQAEVWGEPADRVPMGLVVVECGDRVALGWSGSGRVSLVRSDEPAEPAWIVVRDDQGREARALVADGSGPLSVRAVWTAPGPAGAAPEGVLEADWPGRSTASSEPGAGAQEDRLEPEAEAAVQSEAGMADGSEEAAAGTAVGEEPPVAQATPGPVAEPGAAARSRPFWHFRSWMDKLAEKAAEPEQPVAPSAEPELGAAEPDAPPTLTDPEPIAHDVPGVPDLLPEPGPPVATVLAAEVPPLEAPETGEAAAGPSAAASPGEAPDEPAPLPGGPHSDEPLAGEPLALEPPAAEPLLSAARVAEAAADEEPGSVAFAEPSAPVAAAPRARARRLEWPADERPRARGGLRWRRSWTVAAVLLGLFAAGWGLGRVDVPAAGRAIGSAFTAVGLGPARYEVAVTSRPAGAWIAVDGVDQARRTPATLALKPGRHEITLSVTGEGGSTHPVSGKRGERVALDVALWGGLRIDAPPGSAPLTVTVDGMPRGYVPLVLDRLQPGIHRLQFTGPGVTPWEQTVEVHVNRAAEVLAQPVVSPPTGVLEVRARLSDEMGAEPLAGASVRIDGRYRGVTPLRLELPRGPHSVRVSHRGEESPVQVIDLPGGNQRFATLDLGLNLDQPRLAATLAGRVPHGQPTVLSATLDRAREDDVREMWLHVRTPEGAWRRYPMSMMKAPGGLVGAVVFPTDLFDRGGRAAWYVSALAPTGDEYFTEIQSAQAAAK